MRNETLKNLLLTASLISASAFLTACGDSAKDSATLPTVQDEPSPSVEVIADEIKTDVEDIKNDLDKINGVPNTPTLPLFTALRAEFAKQELAFNEVKVKATAVAAAHKSKSYNDYVAAVEDYKKAIKQVALNIDSIDARKIALYNSPEALNQSVIQVNSNVAQIITKSNAFLKNNLETAFDTDVAKFGEAYTKMYKKDGGLVGTTGYSTFTNELFKATQNKIIEFKSQPLLAGEELKLDNATAKVAELANCFENFVKINADGTVEAVDSTSAISLQNLIKAGKLNDVVSQLYSFIKPRITLTKAYSLGSSYNSYAQYTLNELKIIASKASETAQPAAGSKDVEGLNGKPYPQFDPSKPTLYYGAVPTLTKINEISALFDKELPSVIRTFLLDNDLSTQFFKADRPNAAALSADVIQNISTTSLRQARAATTGLVDGSAFKMNGVAGQSVELGLPLFVQLKGDVSSAKATEATTGSIAYRLGNTVIGAIQGYANSGAGFGTDSRQLETSVVASHSFGAFFLEGQVGTVSATEVHNNNWSGYRSQVTLGLDTAFVSPFVQLAHRQLNRGDVFDLNETAAYVGLDMEVAKLAADTYSVDTRLLAKAGYVAKDWSADTKALGSTTGFTGSVEWSASLNLNSGVAFSSNLALDTTAGSSAGLTVSLDR